jgi:hypothetical protein
MSFVKVHVERSQVDKVMSRTNKITGELEFQQPVWIYKTSSFHPTEFTIRLPSGVKLYPAGDYVADIQDTMQPDRYGGMSVNPFQPLPLIPATPEFLQYFDKLQVQLLEQVNKLRG